MEYRELAHKSGVPAYFRTPAANDDPEFIAALAGLVRAARAHGPGLCAQGSLCPSANRDCPHRRAA
jgi:ferrochelatase